MIRSGIVLAAEGGALTPIVLPFKFFLGGTMGRSHQWTPWIHLADEVRLIRLAIDNPAMSGPFNAAGPEQVTMETLCRTIGQILGRPAWLPGAAIGMRLVLGELSTVLLASLRLVPAVAEQLNFQFTYPTHDAALRVALRGGGQPTPSRVA
jgi:uncharacterized protein (TIGR01777 family)